MSKPGIVHVVHHVDTEGPLHEPLEEIFARVEQTLGIIIGAPRTKEAFTELQQGKWVGDNPAHIATVKKILDPHLIRLHASWKEIDAMLARLLSKEFRNAFPDSFGGSWIFNWHIVDQVGFETNERGKDLGYLKIFNHYEQILKEHNALQDRLHWHFHPIPFFREAHVSATSYENSYPELHQILCHRLIEKNWFPVVNRAGFHTVRPDSNWFLEQWIPFDASNQSMPETKEVQTDAINGRFGDWRGAPDDWSLYHPDLYDWRKPGNLNRVIARVLNLRTRFRNITEEEVRVAFQKAARGESVYLGITNHDFRDMGEEIDDFREMLRNVSAQFPDVPFKFSEAVEAFRAVLGYEAEHIKKEELDFDCALNGNVLTVTCTSGTFFGPQPYVAIKTKDGQYLHDNFDFGEFKKTYFYTFDRNTIPLTDIQTIAVASNDRFGNTVIKRIVF